MLTVGQKIPNFKIRVVKPKFNEPEEKGESAFEWITETSFQEKWKILYFYPKDFTFVCPTEIVEFANLNDAFLERDAIVLGGNGDNEFVKLAWRREHPLLNQLNQYSFADVRGTLIDGLGIRDQEAGVPLRATFIIDQYNVIQHVNVNNLNVGRNPQEVLRILDSLKTGELCACNRPIGGQTLTKK